MAHSPFVNSGRGGLPSIGLLVTSTTAPIGLGLNERNR